MSEPRRVVITGIGAVTPIGIGVEGLWNGLRAGASAVRTITRFDPEPFRTRIAAQVDDFHATDHLEERKARRIDRFGQFTVAATRLAIENAELHLDREDRERTGVMMGTALGGVGMAESQHARYVEGGIRAVDPALALMVFAGAASCNVAIEFGVSGPNSTNGMSCASGTIAIGDGFRAIRRGDADVMLAGGAEAPLAPLSFGAFAIIRAMSTRNDDPGTASRPFDAARDGFVMGEGAAVLVLEERGRALARGARIYAEVCGYGITNDAHHMTAPRPDGAHAARAMRQALAEAGAAGEVGGVRQRPRLLDAAQRLDRDRRHQAGLRRPCRTPGRQRHQGVLRARARRERRHRGRHLRPGQRAGVAPPDHQSPHAGPRLRPRLSCHRRPGGAARVPPEQLVRVRRDQRGAGAAPRRLIRFAAVRTAPLPESRGSRMRQMTRRLVAEFLGTFMLVFFGAGAIMSKSFPKGDFGLLGVALASGLALAIGMTAMMAISGGHLNPAVTAAMTAIRRIDPKTGLLYILVQVLGAVVAALALKSLLPPGVTKVLALGTPSITSTITLGQAIAIEAILTFLLMSAFMGTAVSPTAPKIGGFGVGLLLLVIGTLFGGPLTGAALNPARAFGPALISGQWVSQGVYWVGPILGALVAAFLWEKLLLPKATD